MLTNDAEQRTNCATRYSCVNYVTFAARFPDVTFYRIWAQNVMARHIWVKTAEIISGVQESKQNGLHCYVEILHFVIKLCRLVLSEQSRHLNFTR